MSALLNQGVSRTDAAKAIARQLGLKKKELYALAARLPLPQPSSTEENGKGAGAG
jgi:hypothetical protein